jgi:hypothetical protein
VQGRTIFLSDSAVVARRDGDLKFMFRIADIRPRYQVRFGGFGFELGRRSYQLCCATPRPALQHWVPHS